MKFIFPFMNLAAKSQTFLIFLTIVLASSALVADDTSSKAVEKKLAGDEMAIATAKARAFSRDVTMFQEEYTRNESLLKANQSLYRQKTGESYRNASERKNYQLGPKGQAQQSGDYAGLVHLTTKIDELQAKSKILEAQFEQVLKKATWKEASPAARDLIAKYDLIAKSIRDSVTSNELQTTMTDIQKSKIDQLPDEWVPVKLGNNYELAFPKKPKQLRTDAMVSFDYEVDGVSLSFNQHVSGKVPFWVSTAYAVETQAVEWVEDKLKNGVGAANRSVQLAGLPGQEILSYYREHGRKMVDICRVTVIDRELVTIQLVGIDAADEKLARKFFDSFKKCK